MRRPKTVKEFIIQSLFPKRAEAATLIDHEERTVQGSSPHAHVKATSSDLDVPTVPLLEIQTPAPIDGRAAKAKRDAGAKGAAASKSADRRSSTSAVAVPAPVTPSNFLKSLPSRPATPKKQRSISIWSASFVLVGVVAGAAAGMVYTGRAQVLYARYNSSRTSAPPPAAAAPVAASPQAMPPDIAAALGSAPPAAPLATSPAPAVTLPPVVFVTPAEPSKTVAAKAQDSTSSKPARAASEHRHARATTASVPSAAPKADDEDLLADDTKAPPPAKSVKDGRSTTQPRPADKPAASKASDELAAAMPSAAPQAAPPAPAKPASVGDLAKEQLGNALP